MADAMPGQKGHAFAIQRANHQRRAGAAKRRIDFYTLRIGQAIHMIKTRSTNYPENRLVCHGLVSFFLDSNEQGNLPYTQFIT